MFENKKTEKYNNLFLEKLSIFLNGSDNINEQDIKTLMKEVNISSEEAMLYILGAKLGFNIYGEDRDIFELYLKESIKLLPISLYKNNLYYKNIKLENIKYKNWRLTHKEYQPYEFFVYNDLLKYNDGRIMPRIGYFNVTYKYPCVLENDREWMLITPNEIETMALPIKNATGKVLTYGLGLGYFSYMVSMKKDVQKITIIENNSDIIFLFKKYILPQFKYKDKIEIINMDALNYKYNTTMYDYVFVDIWHDPSDGVNLYKQMKLLEKENIIYDYWIEETLKYYL